MEHSCPLANETISLVDGKVIPVASNFSEVQSDTACWWKFQISAEQRLKIVIQHVNFTNPFSLDLETDGGVIARYGKNWLQNTFQNGFRFNNTNGEVLPTAFYFSSTSGEFVLKFDSTGSYTAGFFATVSAVDKHFTYPNDQCKTDTGDDYGNIYYWDFNEEKGYPPNYVSKFIFKNEDWARVYDLRGYPSDFGISNYEESESEVSFNICFSNVNGTSWFSQINSFTLNLMASVLKKTEIKLFWSSKIMTLYH